MTPVGGDHPDAVGLAPDDDGAGSIPKLGRADEGRPDLS